MSCRWLQGIAALALLGWGEPVEGSTFRVTLGLEYDDNPFETAESRRAGWVSRLYLSSSGRLLEREWGNLQVRHQSGLKRFWKAEEVDGSSGDVVANHLELGGSVRLHERVVAGWGSELKVKNVQRVSSEESYLRGGYRFDLTGQWGSRFSGVINYRRGSDDARDLRLVDVSQHELGLVFHYNRSRRLRGHAGLRWRRVGYARPALELEEDGGFSEGDEDQEDRGLEWGAGIQYYRGVLIHASYAFIDNSSNSLGYGYKTHRLLLLLTRHIVYGVDGQFYFTTQLRRYDQDFSTMLPTAAGEQDEYEQNLFSVKLARQLSERYGISWQYKYSRNGSRGKDDFFRKNIYSLAIDMVL